MVDPDIVAAFNCSLEFSPPGLNMPLFTVCWRNALYIVNNNEKLKVWMWSIHSCVTIWTMVEAELSNCWMHLLSQSSEEVYNSGFIIFHMGSSLWCLNMSSPFSMRGVSVVCTHVTGGGLISTWEKCMHTIQLHAISPVHSKLCPTENTDV